MKESCVSLGALRLRSASPCYARACRGPDQCYAASQMVLGPMYLGLIERLLALLPSVWLMLGATHHDWLHADRYLVRACGAQKISHASLGHRREEDEDGEQGEEKVAREPCASHHRIVTERVRPLDAARSVKRRGHSQRTTIFCLGAVH